MEMSGWLIGAIKEVSSRFRLVDDSSGKYHKTMRMKLTAERLQVNYSIIILP